MTDSAAEQTERSTNSTAKLREQTRLRRAAEGLLSGGQAPPSRGWELGTDALALLYRLASDTNGSDDALAVLHELQVHQVELDLQLEQLETNEEHLTEDLQRYRDFFEQAPVGYLRIRPDGRILEANQAASRMLASLDDDARTRWEGACIEELIAPADRPSVTSMLQKIAISAENTVLGCEVRAIDAAAETPALRITAKLEPGSDNVWLIVS